jgi:hypothetical protein
MAIVVMLIVAVVFLAVVLAVWCYRPRKPRRPTFAGHNLPAAKFIYKEASLSQDQISIVAGEITTTLLNAPEIREALALKTEEGFTARIAMVYFSRKVEANAKNAETARYDLAIGLLLTGKPLPTKIQQDLEKDGFATCDFPETSGMCGRVQRTSRDGHLAQGLDMYEAYEQQDGDAPALAAKYGVHFFEILDPEQVIYYRPKTQLPQIKVATYPRGVLSATSDKKKD